MTMYKKRPLHWAEPAHPSLVHDYATLVEVYKYLAKQRDAIDQAFDAASREIGYVVRTTLPVEVTIAKGHVEAMSLADEDSGETVFARVFQPLFKSPDTREAVKAPDGVCAAHAIWYQALRLRLRRDWLEPAHFFHTEPAHVGQVNVEMVGRARRVARDWGPYEPAHWFDGRVLIDADEGLHIAAIDEAYPELQLGRQVAAAREATRIQATARAMSPGIREPAHYRELIDALLSSPELRTRRAGPREALLPGIREPAHFLRVESLLKSEQGAQLVAELEEVLQRYGL